MLPGATATVKVDIKGFKFSPVIGEIVADLVTRGASHFDLTPFSLERFR